MLVCLGPQGVFKSRNILVLFVALSSQLNSQPVRFILSNILRDIAKEFWNRFADACGKGEDSLMVNSEEWVFCRGFVLLLLLICGVWSKTRSINHS